MKWLRLCQLHYRGRDGVERPWEAVERTTGAAGRVDAVEVCAVRREADGATRSVLIVTQFRAPVGCPSVEFPAGLVDAGETAADAALRELREETGYIGVVQNCSPPCSYDPGMSGSAMTFVRVSIDMTDDRNRFPVATPEEGEDIKCDWVPLKGLMTFLEACAARGERIDGKLYTFAAALAEAV